MNKKEKSDLIKQMSQFITHRQRDYYNILGEHMAECALQALDKAGYEVVVRDSYPRGVACSSKDCNY